MSIPKIPPPVSIRTLPAPTPEAGRSSGLAAVWDGLAFLAAVAAALLAVFAFATLNDGRAEWIDKARDGGAYVVGLIASVVFAASARTIAVWLRGRA